MYPDNSNPSVIESPINKKPFKLSELLFTLIVSPFPPKFGNLVATSALINFFTNSTSFNASHFFPISLTADLIFSSIPSINSK